MHIVFSCAGIPEYHDISNAKFFKDHPDLKWTLTSTSAAANTPGVIKVGPWNQILGLVDFTFGNGTFQTIGKVEAGGVNHHIPGSGVETWKTGDVFVLTCGACTNGGSGMFCCSNGATSRL